MDRNQARFGPISADIAQCWSQPGRLRPSVGQPRPKSPTAGSVRSKFGRHAARHGRNRPSLAEISLTLEAIGQNPTGSTNICPTPNESCPKASECRSSQIWSNPAAKVAPKSNRMHSESRSISGHAGAESRQRRSVFAIVLAPMCHRRRPDLGAKVSMGKVAAVRAICKHFKWGRSGQV